MDSASYLLCHSRFPAIFTLLWTWVFPFGSWGSLISAFLPRDCEDVGPGSGIWVAPAGLAPGGMGGCA